MDIGEVVEVVGSSVEAVFDNVLGVAVVVGNHVQFDWQITFLKWSHSFELTLPSVPTTHFLLPAWIWISLKGVKLMRRSSVVFNSLPLHPLSLQVTSSGLTRFIQYWFFSDIRCWIIQIGKNVY